MRSLMEPLSIEASGRLMMPKFPSYAILTIIILALIPPALIARKRVAERSRAAAHPLHPGHGQPAPLPRPADEPAVRRRPRHASAGRGHRRARRAGRDEHFERGLVNGDDVGDDLPAEQITVDMALLRAARSGSTSTASRVTGCPATATASCTSGRGPAQLDRRQRHDLGRAQEPARGRIREQPIGQIYNTITNGVRNMAGYGAQIPTEDRWAIVAYVKAAAAQPERGASTTCRRRSGPRLPTIASNPQRRNPKLVSAVRTPSVPSDRRRLGDLAPKLFMSRRAGRSALVPRRVAGRSPCWPRLGRGFLRSYLVAFMFGLSICLGGLFWTAIQHATRAGWGVVLRRLSEGGDEQPAVVSGSSSSRSPSACG